jgi:hypothetical protein
MPVALSCAAATVCSLHSCTARAVTALAEYLALCTLRHHDVACTPATAAVAFGPQRLSAGQGAPGRAVHGTGLGQ